VNDSPDGFEQFVQTIQPLHEFEHNDDHEHFLRLQHRGSYVVLDLRDHSRRKTADGNCEIESVPTARPECCRAESIEPHDGVHSVYKRNGNEETAFVDVSFHHSYEGSGLLTADDIVNRLEAIRLRSMVALAQPAVINLMFVQELTTIQEVEDKTQSSSFVTTSHAWTLLSGRTFGLLDGCWRRMSF
jgi:hypothetical protein